VSGDFEPRYTPTGLNECLRIGSLSYIYEPELDAWTHDYRTPEGFFAQHVLSAHDIHAITWEGRYKVTTWEPEL
jgi:hypothetical protein